MRIVWKETEHWPIRCGHGVEFLAHGVSASNSLFAFLEGYRWLKEAPDEVVILIRKSDSEFSEGFLSDARKTIEEAMISGRLRNGILNVKIRALFNA